MSRGYSRTQIIGNLGADVEMRYSAAGTAVANFNVAVSNGRKNAQGEYEDVTEWYRVVVWDKLAETCNQYLRKGSKVFLEGSMQTRKYTDKEGQERTSVELIAREMLMLDGRQQDGQGGGAPQGRPQQQAPRQQTPRPAAGRSQTQAKQDNYDSDLDDVPFD